MNPKWMKFKPCSEEEYKTRDHYKYYPFKYGKQYIFLGEIENQPGHGIYILENGKVVVGYHTEMFIDPEPGDLGISIEFTDDGVNVEPL